MSKKDYRSDDTGGRVIAGLIFTAIIASIFGLIKLFEWLSNL